MEKRSSYTLAAIIPCWNCESFIGEMLDGLLSQSFSDWKAFLVDDGCTDGTAAIIKSYSEKDARIHYFLRNRGPKGAQTCRNIGFDLSEGAKYVVFFDADDVIARYCFEQRVQYLEIRQDLDFGVFLAKSFVADPREIERTLLFGFRYNGVDDLQRLLRRTHPFVVCTNIYRRSSLIQANLKWDERLLSLQDSDFNIQAIQRGLRYDFDDNSRIDYFYRTWHNTGSTSRHIFSDAHKKSHLLFIEKLYHSLSKEQVKKYKIEIDDYLFYFIERFLYDQHFLSALLQLDGIRQRFLFCLKVRAYCMLKRNKRNGKKWLFPALYSYRREYDLQYREYQQVLLGKSINLIEF